MFSVVLELQYKEIKMLGKLIQIFSPIYFNLIKKAFVTFLYLP